MTPSLLLSLLFSISTDSNFLFSALYPPYFLDTFIICLSSQIPLSYAFPLTWIPGVPTFWLWASFGLSSTQFPVVYSFAHSFIHSFNPWFELLLNPSSLRHMPISPQLLRDKLHVPFSLSQVYSCLLFSFVVFISSGIFVTPYITPIGCQPRRY